MVDTEGACPKSERHTGRSRPCWLLLYSVRSSWCPLYHIGDGYIKSFIEQAAPQLVAHTKARLSLVESCSMGKGHGLNIRPIKYCMQLLG